MFYIIKIPKNDIFNIKSKTLKHIPHLDTDGNIAGPLVLRFCWWPTDEEKAVGLSSSVTKVTDGHPSVKVITDSLPTENIWPVGSLIADDGSRQ